MSLKHFSICLAMALAAACGFATAAEEAADEKECGEFGTSVLFAESPAEAAKFALQGMSTQPRRQPPSKPLSV